MELSGCGQQHHTLGSTDTGPGHEWQSSVLSAPDMDPLLSHKALQAHWSGTVAQAACHCHVQVSASVACADHSMVLPVWAVSALHKLGIVSYMLVVCIAHCNLTMHYHVSPLHHDANLSFVHPWTELSALQDMALSRGGMRCSIQISMHSRQRDCAHMQQKCQRMMRIGMQLSSQVKDVAIAMHRPVHAGNCAVACMPLAGATWFTLGFVIFQAQPVLS